MKKLNLFVVILLLSQGKSFSQCTYNSASAYCNNSTLDNTKKRGMYVDYFLTLDGTGSVVQPYSILGNSTKENTLLQYARDQSIDVLYLYDLGTIFDHLNDPYDLGGGNPTYGQLLDAFMNKAKTVYNIRQLGACVSSKDQSREIYQWDGRPLWACETIGNPGDIQDRIKKIDDFITNEVGTERYCPALELTKLTLEVFAFNELWNGDIFDYTRKLPFSCHGTHSRFDRIMTENEFWSHGVANQAALDANTADYYNTYVPLLGLGACLRSYSGCPLFIDTYLGFMDWDNVDNLQQAWLIDWKCDRVCLHAYTCKSDNLFDFFNRFQGFTRRLDLFGDGTTKPHSELWPIFSAEKIAWYDAAAPNPSINQNDYLGPYLSDDNQLTYNPTYGGYTWACAENIFQAECDATNTSDCVMNGYLWFTYSCLHENLEQITFKNRKPFYENINLYCFQNNNRSISIVVEHTKRLDIILNVVDVLGRNIFSQRITNDEFTIDLPSGLYSLNLINNNEVIKTEKILVVN